MGTYQKAKVIQSYLMIWRGYDPIELGPTEPKNGELAVNTNKLPYWGLVIMAPQWYQKN